MVEKSKLPRRRVGRLAFGYDVSTCLRMLELAHKVSVYHIRAHTHTHSIRQMVQGW